MNKKWLSHVITIGAFAFFIALGLASASRPERSSTTFPPDYEGTWKRDNFNNTLTFTSTTLQSSSQDSPWTLKNIFGDEYILTIGNNNVAGIIIKSINGDLEISGDRGDGEDNWNGTWKRQSGTTVIVTGETGGNDNNGGTTIYTAGYYNNGRNDIACYWKGTTRTDLPDGGLGIANANAITVSDGIVYTAGSYQPGVSYIQGGILRNSFEEIACYWTGTTRTDLTGKGGTAKANAITVSSETIYTAGWHWTRGNNYACYWKGITKTDLPGDNAIANDITVSDGTVYTAGHYTGDISSIMKREGGLVFADSNKVNIPCYWTGTTRTDLPIPVGAYGAEATAITVSGRTIYTAGYYRDNSNKWIACYWKGTTRTDMTTGSGNARALDITVKDGTIYTAGWYNSGSKGIACYWTDNNRIDLEAPGNAGASAITVSNGIVYTAGDYGSGTNFTPCYWTGTTITSLRMPAGVKGATAKAIAVVP